MRTNRFSALMKDLFELLEVLKVTECFHSKLNSLVSNIMNKSLMIWALQIPQTSKRVSAIFDFLWPWCNVCSLLCMFRHNLQLKLGLGLEIFNSAVFMYSVWRLYMVFLFYSIRFDYINRTKCMIIVLRSISTVDVWIGVVFIFLSILM